MFRHPLVLFLSFLFLAILAGPSRAELGIVPQVKNVDEYRQYNPEPKWVMPKGTSQDDGYNRGLQDLDDDFNGAVQVLNDGRQEAYTEELTQRYEEEIQHIRNGGYKPIHEEMPKFIEAKIPEAKSEYAIRPNR